MKKSFFSFVLLSLLFFSACLIFKNTSIEEPVLFNAFEAYYSIVNSLDKEYPGRGIDVFDSIKKDRPMAYGLILSAECNRYKFTQDSLALKIVRICGNWLLKNSDLNHNGIHGYGLADPWDAFADKTTNQPHQEYTITTAFALNGLLDWYDLETDTLVTTKIQEIVTQCFTPYLDDCNHSPMDIPGYSFNPNDLGYDSYNPAVYLAGQMKRFAHITNNEKLKNCLNKKSKHIIDILMENYQKDSNENIFWDYGSYSPRPHDLLHMCYIVEGIRNFRDYGGEVNVDWDKVINHSSKFYTRNTWYEYNEKGYQNKEFNSRLWSLGMLIYTFAKEKKYETIRETILPQLAAYKKPDGHFKFKLNDDRTMVRQEAYLLLGLSNYLFNDNQRVETSKEL